MIKLFRKISPDYENLSDKEILQLMEKQKKDILKNTQNTRKKSKYSYIHDNFKKQLAQLGELYNKILKS